MKRSCYSIKTKIIAGAGLDVFEIEPIKKNHPFMKLENIVLAPHIELQQKRLESKWQN